MWMDWKGLGCNALQRYRREEPGYHLTDKAHIVELSQEPRTGNALRHRIWTTQEGDNAIADQTSRHGRLSPLREGDCLTGRTVDRPYCRLAGRRRRPVLGCRQHRFLASELQPPFGAGSRRRRSAAGRTGRYGMVRAMQDVPAARELCGKRQSMEWTPGQVPVVQFKETAGGSVDSRL